MRQVKIPDTIPVKYHHEIKCLLEDQHNRAICDILTFNLEDDLFLQIAERLIGMDKTPMAVLKVLASMPYTNPISARVYKIKMEQKGT